MSPSLDGIKDMGVGATSVTGAMPLLGLKGVPASPISPSSNTNGRGIKNSTSQSLNRAGGGGSNAAISDVAIALVKSFKTCAFQLTRIALPHVFADTRALVPSDYSAHLLVVRTPAPFPFFFLKVI